jgi:hypothetical protein
MAESGNAVGIVAVGIMTCNRIYMLKMALRNAFEFICFIFFSIIDDPACS